MDSAEMKDIVPSLVYDPMNTHSGAPHQRHSTNSNKSDFKKKSKSAVAGGANRLRVRSNSNHSNNLNNSYF